MDVNKSILNAYAMMFGILLGILLSTFAYAGMVVNLSEEVETQSNNSSGSGPSIRNISSHVYLASNYFHYKGDVETIYDFEKKGYIFSRSYKAKLLIDVSIRKCWI